MKVGLLADPHANAAGLAAALDALRRADVETIVCAGDAVGYHTAVNETIAALRSSVEHVVLGNHDAMLIGRLPVDDEHRALYGLDYAASVIAPEALSWLEGLPTTLELELDGCSVAVFHGSPWHPLTEYVYPDSPDFERFAAVDADVVVLGHTHHPMVREVAQRVVVNPGSCGLPRDGRGGAPYAVLDTRTREIASHRASYDEASVSSPFLDRLRER